MNHINRKSYCGISAMKRWLKGLNRKHIKITLAYKTALITAIPITSGTLPMNDQRKPYNKMTKPVLSSKIKKQKTIDGVK